MFFNASSATGCAGRNREENVAHASETSEKEEKKNCASPVPHYTTIARYSTWML